MQFHILESGSKGNCTIIKSTNTTIVIDCGGTIAYLKEHFKQVDVDYTEIDGLLITHSHSDHCKQIKMFEKSMVYTPFVIDSVKKQTLIEPYTVFKINDLKILPIALSHDCAITVGYIISDGKETLACVTDSGYLSNNNIELIRGADYYIFESNHDPEMLMHAKRPEFTKKRILSDNGHMSNEYASDILSHLISSKTKEIVLAHISLEANTYQLAYDTLIKTLDEKGIDYQNIKIKTAKQFETVSSETN